MDEDIVWPPVVIIDGIPIKRNAETRKFEGMGNEEIKKDIAEVIEGVEYRSLKPHYRHDGQRSEAFLVFPSTPTGYDHAMKVHAAFRDRRHDRRKNGQLDGYLATPRDMQELDPRIPRRKTTVTWTVESLEEKVLKPRRDSAKEYEDNLKLQRDLQQINEAYVSEINNDSQVTKALEEELERKRVEAEAEAQRSTTIQSTYRTKIEQRRADLEAERAKQLQQVRRQNEELLARLKREREDAKAKAMQIRREEKLLNDGMDARMRQLQESAWLLNEQQLNLKLEEKLTALKEEQHRRMMELRQKYNNERMELAAKKQEKKKQLLEEQVKEREAMTEASRSTCSICLEDYGRERKRALYNCGHSCVCEECLPVVWKSKKECPVCRSRQDTMPTLLHLYA